MSDKEHVEAVTAAARLLNTALLRAAMDGIETRLSLDCEENHDRVSISNMQRVVTLWKGEE